jgi:hypothetical protein
MKQCYMDLFCTSGRQLPILSSKTAADVVKDSVVYGEFLYLLFSMGIDLLKIETGESDGI